MLAPTLQEPRPKERSHEFVFLVVAIALTSIGNEFATSGGISPWFQRTSFGIPAHFILFFLLLVVLAPYVVTAPKFAMSQEMRNEGILAVASLAWVVIGITIAIAILRGVPELFADWRNLLVTTVAAVYAAKFLASRDWKHFVLIDLATAYGLLAIPTLGAYAAGLGQSVLGVRTTVFDGPTLYLASFATITSAWFYLNPDPRHGRVRSVWLQIAGLSSSLLVLLSFRRSFWLAWIAGIATVLIVSWRSRDKRGVRLYGSLLGLCLLVNVATVAIGSETMAARLESFLPNSTGQFSATNQDHLNDIVDAWQVIKAEPVLGLGIGSQYETNLISDWKTESFEVHSAVLHVWLKFGILGALIYLAFHVALIRAATRKRELIPIAAFLSANWQPPFLGRGPTAASRYRSFTAS